MINKSGSKTLIVFDIDGTLTDSVAVHQQALTDSLEELGVKKINSNYGEYKHHTDSYIAKTIYEGYFNKEYCNDLQNEFESKILDRINKNPIAEIPGACALIRKLGLDENYDFCFATGSLEKPAKYKLDCHGISYHTDTLVCSNKLHSREDIVETAIQKAKEYYKYMSYGRIISVGDGLWDLKTAKNLGLEFIGIGEKNKDILIDNECTKYFDDLTEIELNEL